MRLERIGKADLYLADCLEVVGSEELPKIDVLVTDPPYDHKTHRGALVKIDFEPLESLETCRILLHIPERWALFFCALEMLGKYKSLAPENWIRAAVWDRVQNMPQMSGDRPAQAVEGIAVMHRPGRKHWNGGGDAAIYRHPVERGHLEHPTQKPITLMSELIRLFSDSGEMIFDPFMGSGSTGVAAVKANRNFIGVEIDPEYFGIACERIDQAQRQQRLFA